MYNAKEFKTSPLFSRTHNDPAIPETRVSVVQVAMVKGEASSLCLIRFSLGIMLILLEGVRGKLVPDLRVSDDLWIAGKPEKPAWGLEPGCRANGSFPR